MISKFLTSLSTPLAAVSVKDLWDQVGSALHHTLFQINETEVNGFGLIRLALLLIFAWWLSKLLRRALRKLGLHKSSAGKSTLYTLERLTHYLVLVIAVFMGLGSIGLDFTKLAIFASAMGVGLGFGLQNIFSNFVAGLIVLFEKSLNIGDFIELQSGVTGEVKEINMRSTLITTNDNVDILVPNSEFVTTQVTNWTLREVYRRIHVPFGVAYGTDKELVRKSLIDCAGKIKGVLVDNEQRKPQVWLVKFGDSSLDFELVVWLTPDAVKRPGAMHAEILWQIESELKKNNIEIPFPQRDLHIKSGYDASKNDAVQITPTPTVRD